MATSCVPSRKLRFMTYLCPTLPVEYFETIIRYLEHKIGFESYLLYESRYEGPPEGAPDPFSLDDVDIGFVGSSTFLRMLNENNPHVELLPAVAVHIHTRNIKKEPHFYTDVVIHPSNCEKYEDFHQLKGCRWAYTRDSSLSGYLTTLKYLKDEGTNANFFGNIIKSGSHIKSIDMVANHTVDAAAVSSNSLSCYLERNPYLRTKIHILTSWGPLPSSPIVINSRLPGGFKELVTSALLEMHQHEEWKEELNKFCVDKFVSVDKSLYDHEVELTEGTKQLSLDTVYY